MTVPVIQEMDRTRTAHLDALRKALADPDLDPVMVALECEATISAIKQLLALSEPDNAG